MVSTTFESPIRPPQRKLSSTYAPDLMLLHHPATIISASPHWELLSSQPAMPSNPTTNLVDSKGWCKLGVLHECSGLMSYADPTQLVHSPIINWVYLLWFDIGFFPKSTLITKAPKSTAETFFKLPPKEPIGVRTAETITMSFITAPVYTLFIIM